ncbi:hypothetical protein FOCC_FOCC009424, partial [Frankliniella occidentalis]
MKMGSSSHVDDSITRKYDIKRRIGKGAYGIVWKAVDRSTNRLVAVKKIFDAFCNSTDAQRTFREIMFLQEFRNHSNIVKLLNIHRASNDKDIYLIFEFMETDLHKVIKRKLLQDLHKRFIMYQLLRATFYIHSGNVIHRDQKPSNILLDSYCRCKVADFGLARSLATDGAGAEGLTGDPALTDYVATRWYRAPEILVASKQYTKGIDMWSLGCILAEMLLGKPLFPGSSTINQVEKIMATIDPPTPADLACVCPGYGSSLFTRAPAGPRLPLTELLRGSPVEGVDLVCRLLVLNPFKRLTAEQALEHPYVARFRRQGREPALQHQVVPPLSDHVQLSVGEYRSKLYEMYQ